VCDHFRERQVRRIDVEVALDDLQIGRDAAEELEGFFGRYVSQA
jgi:hypothetical protein